MNQARRQPHSVLVVVHTRDGQVLLLERADRPGFWQSVTGSIEAGESPAQAARRELEEETGIDACPEPVGITRMFEIYPEYRARYAPGTTHNREREFRVLLPRAVRVSLSEPEHRQARWVSIPEALSMARSWSNREAIAQILVERLCGDRA